MNRRSFPPVLAILCALALAAFAAPARAEDTSKSTEWPVYGGDKGNRKYSPLDQIKAENVKDLQVAWRWKSADTELQKTNPKLGDRRMSTFQFEGTPIMVNGVLYVSTSYSQVAAINPKTGEQIWVHDPKSYDFGRPTNLGFVHRGVAFWQHDGKDRIFIGTGDAHLVCIDAKTGQADPNFGENGRVDLTKGLGREVDRRYYAVTSPPIVCRGVVSVGASIFDGPTRKEMPPGHVRGFDCATGEMKWIFHTIAQKGEFGYETWEDGSAEYTGNANVWTMMAADDELGYIYLPIGTPTNDWYGGHRLGQGLFGESLVCVKAETGERVWHYQMVHHGVWDYDPPAGPILCDINVGGKKIKAVAQITKQAFTFVFDRATGEPVWPIEEKPVPPSDVPGEKLSPTQPHPTKPAPFDRQGVTEEDIIDFTPEIKAAAMETLKKYKYGALFTPPSEQGTIQLPGWNGGANWGGAPFDPETGILYVASTTNPISVKLGQPDAARSNFQYVRQGSLWVSGPKGLPLFKPPYGRITAIDMNTGEHAWMAVRGDGPRNHPSLKDLNLPKLGTTARGYGLATKTLLFYGDEGSMGGPGGAPAVFRSFDKKSGDLIHETPIPGPTTGAPMTYLMEGKQYIVVPTETEESPAGELVALALP